MWSLNASRCFQASATWWRPPKLKGPPVTRASSDFVGARTSQMRGTAKKAANAARIVNRRPRTSEPHQSSLLNSPVRLTMSTAATSPIAIRSIEMAAAALKSPYRKAIW